MVITKVKRRYHIEKVEITQLERFKPIEIRLPSNMAKVVGLLVTASRKVPFVTEGQRLGLISFQARDKSDVFHVAEVFEDGVALSDSQLLSIDEPQFESEAPWVTGHVPKIKTINIEGDNVLVRAWLKGEAFPGAYTIRIYIEYEEAEQLETVVSDEISAPTELDKILEPREVYL